MKSRSAIVVAALLVALGCSRDQWQRAPGPDDVVALVPWFANMKTDIAVRPYKLPLMPVEGTVPTSGAEPTLPIATPANDALLGRMLPNPIPSSAASIERGRDRFNIYCAVCHGEQALGNGPVAAQGQPMAGIVPSLVTPRAQGYTDGYLYAMVKNGRGLMREYGDRIRGDDRWHVVNYLRVLQGIAR